MELKCGRHTLDRYAKGHKNLVCGAILKPIPMDANKSNLSAADEVESYCPDCGQVYDKTGIVCGGRDTRLVFSPRENVFNNLWTSGLF